MSGRGQMWRERYEAGATFEEIALDEGTTPATVRKEALAAGLTPRRSGQRVGKPHKNRSDCADTSASPAMPTARIVRPSVARRYR